MTRRRTHEDILNPERLFHGLIRDYSAGRLTDRQFIFRARVEGVDTEGGQLEAAPPNPPNSVRARVYTNGLDATTPSEALVVFYPMFPPNVGGSVMPGEHVLVMFEDESKTSGFWISTVPSFYDANYANPDFRDPSAPDSSYSFEGDETVESSVLPDLEYGGSTTQTEGRQELIDMSETDPETNPWQGKRVLLIGDSQVAGAFGSLLGEELRSNQQVASFHKEGRVGWGVYSWLSGQLTSTSPRMASLQQLIEQHNPEIIIISLGGNDGSSGRARRSDYEQKVNELYQIAVNSGAKVIWSGPPTATGRGSRLQAGRNLAATKIRNVVGDNFVDVSDVTNTTQGRTPDGVHFRRTSPALEPWAEAVVRKGYTLE